MLKFKRTTLSINGEAIKGYRVEGLDKRFRGLQVAVINHSGRWHAYEATTGTSITPPSWAGGFSNKTREGILQIVAIHLSNATESRWTHVQSLIAYDLENEPTDTVDAFELQLAKKGAKALYDLLTGLDLPQGLTDTAELTKTQREGIKRLGEQIAKHAAAEPLH